jgi:hypothetical protein
MTVTNLRDVLLCPDKNRHDYPRISGEWKGWGQTLATIINSGLIMYLY